MNKNRLTIQGVRFGYKEDIIFEDLNLTFQSGINVLLGANGCGKTTLFKMLAGVTSPDIGIIRLNDKEYGRDEVRPYLSYIPQNFNVFPTLTVQELLEYVGKIKYGLKGPALKEQVERAATLADVTEFRKKKMRQLSEGMRRRVGIAQALIGEATLIIADEPTAGLDPEQRFKFNQVVQRIPKEKIVILSTHIIEDIQKFSDQVYIMSKGKVGYQGSYEDLLHSLDGRVFEARLPAQGDPEQFSDRAKILSRDFTDTEMILHLGFYQRPEDQAGLTPVTPDLAEIWSYYE